MSSYHRQYVLDNPIARTPTGRLVHLLIANYCDNQGRLAISYNELAEMCSCTPPMARSAVDDLVRRGAMSRVNEANRERCSYQMLDYIFHQITISLKKNDNKGLPPPDK